jgi:hypothetical protein
MLEKSLVNKQLETAKQDCLKLGEARSFVEAFPRCELYMKSACTKMTAQALYPPKNKRLSLSGKLGAKDWRPSDQTYLMFLRVRHEVAGNDAMWKCPSP